MDRPYQPDLAFILSSGERDSKTIPVVPVVLHGIGASDGLRYTIYLIEFARPTSPIMMMVVITHRVFIRYGAKQCDSL
jgi:hypothetical protein